MATKFTYQLQEEDYLTQHLFLVSQVSGNKRKIRWIIMTGACFFMSYYMYTKGDAWFTTYFLIIGVLILFFYPMYLRWLYTRHYKKHIRNNFSNNFNKDVSLILESDHLISDDYESQNKINYSTLEYMVELKQHYFLKFSGGMLLILPKERIEDLPKLKEELQKISKEHEVPINDGTKWKWR
ncbi:YcxB family protein [Fulvivirga ligni]|uniref:YcxB family protein n=1 Tax=Fulvivirga ligni TaxID=2904246 RepID=UPI001F21FCD6|nr:YcxB family protein [Fulvivirga ligni]UII20160.1 YcxB family protein [Fulvivirga ligni]